MNHLLHLVVSKNKIVKVKRNGIRLKLFKFLRGKVQIIILEPENLLEKSLSHKKQRKENYAGKNNVI